MPIKELIEFIDEPNIADDLDEETLKLLGGDVVDRFNQDTDSMKDWDEAVEAGLKLIKQELHPKSTPWNGAANFKSPIITEASLAFGNRAGLELMRHRDLVQADVIGKDESGDKEKRADRVTEAMNYQINHEMKEWRPDQKRLLYTLPNVGTMFKKTIFDPLQGRNVSHIIHYPDFAVNQATTNIDTARSFTHILDRSKNQVIENQRAGIWSDVEIYTEEADGDEGSNEEEEVENATDNPNQFLEQYCFADLDDDGYEEPYIVTVHQQTKKVMRVVPRFDEDSIIVKEDGKIKTLKQVRKEREAQSEQFASSLRIPTQDTDILKDIELVRIEADQPITKYGFVPSQDGTFLDLGYFHLIGAITMGINTTTNQLLDAGTLANRQSGVLAKGFRKKMGPIAFKPGEFKSTEVPAGQLKDSILPLPIKEPSPTLMVLNDKLNIQGREFAVSVDASGQIQANTAPTTALAIIQEQLIPLSALMGRIIDAESMEFQRMFKLNQKFMDPEQYKVILDDPNADSKADFNSEGFDIVPTANAEMTSKMQRLQMAEVEMSQFDRVVQVGGNAPAILRNFYKAIGSDIEEIFPEQDKMSPEDKAQLDRLTQAQEDQNKLLQQQNQIAELQAELFRRDVDRKDFEAGKKAEKTDAEIENIDADTEKTLAEIPEVQSSTILNLEKAESEEVKNQIDIYTAEQAGQPEG